MVPARPAALYNLVVGVIAWLGLPPEGALYVVFVASLLGTGLLLHGPLVRWGIGPIVSGLIVGLALLNPSLLSTMTIATRCRWRCCWWRRCGRCSATSTSLAPDGCWPPRRS